MDDPGFTPISKSEDTAVSMGNCPVCDADHVPISHVAGVQCCPDCYRHDWVRKAIIQAARDHRLARRTHRRMD